MYLSTILLILTTLLSTPAVATNALSPLEVAGQYYSTNAAEQSYLESVCLPNITNPVPPCQEIIDIQTACQPNGTRELDAIAHAECMCGGSFFPDWIGCLACTYTHGLLTEQYLSAQHSLLSSASTLLCTETPRADFMNIFTSISHTFVFPTATITPSDQFPSQSAVSLYYTPSGTQGPGEITGTATLATRVPWTSLSGVVAKTTTRTWDTVPETTVAAVSGTGTVGEGEGVSGKSESGAVLDRKLGREWLGVIIFAMVVLGFQA